MRCAPLAETVFPNSISAKTHRTTQLIRTPLSTIAPRHPALTWVNTILGNIKRSLHGTYHHLSSKHLPRYLAEFSYRFNRRFSLREMFPRLAFVALRTPPMPYRVLKLAENYF